METQEPTISDVLTRKKELEDKIRKLIGDFEKETAAHVDGVILRHVDVTANGDARRRSLLQDVSIEVSLE